MDVVNTETVSLPEAARRLGLTMAEVWDLVMDRGLRSVAAPSGRRVVPLDALEDYRNAQQSVGS